MNHDLIDRYIYAATRQLRRDKREDVARELSTLIDDLLAERCGGRTPAEQDVRVVLTELGTPGDLAAKYASQENRCLIGQPHYETYRFVLKIVLACVALGMTIVTGITLLTEGGAWYRAVFSWLGLLWNGLLSAFAIVTMLFAVFYRKGIQLGEPWNLDSLPPVPKKNQEISRWECGFGMGFPLLFLLVMLLAPQVFSAHISETGEWIPILDPRAIRDSWYLLVPFALLGVVRDGVKLWEGHYNRSVLLTTLGADILSGILAALWLCRFDILNPQFTQWVSRLFAEESTRISAIFANFQAFFLGIILFALVLDAGEAVWKTLSACNPVTQEKP